MKNIKEKVFFLQLRVCKYELCGEEFNPNRKDKVFCSRNCKNKNTKRSNYIKNKSKGVITI